MTTTPATRPTPTLDRMFDALRRSPVTRSRQRLVAGVCSGLAERLGVSVAIVRVLAVVALLLGPALFLYLAAWLLLPDADGGIRLEKAVRGGNAASIVLLVATLLAVVPDSGLHPHVGFVVPVFALAAIGLFFWSRSRRPATSPWSTPQTSQPVQPVQPVQPTPPSSSTSPQDTPPV